MKSPGRRKPEPIFSCEERESGEPTREYQGRHRYVHIDTNSLSEMIWDKEEVPAEWKEDYVIRQFSGKGDVQDWELKRNHASVTSRNGSTESIWRDYRHAIDAKLRARDQQVGFRQHKTYPAHRYYSSSPILYTPHLLFASIQILHIPHRYSSSRQFLQRPHHYSGYIKMDPVHSMHVASPHIQQDRPLYRSHRYSSVSRQSLHRSHHHLRIKTDPELTTSLLLAPKQTMHRPRGYSTLATKSNHADTTLLLLPPK